MSDRVSKEIVFGDHAELIENAVIFGFGILFGYHIFSKNGGWWPKKRKHADSELDSDEEVNSY